MQRRIIVIASLLFIVAAFVIFMIARGCNREKAASSSQDKSTAAKAVSSTVAATRTEGDRVSSGALTDMPLAVAIMEAEQAIAGGADAKAVLAALKEKLLALDPKTASAAICAYLASGRDVETGMPFVVGPNGEILSATSMRGYLLDLLLTVDPQAALAEAETVFEAKISSDEYAICLRNVGKIDTSAEGRAYVGQRARELLSSSLATTPTAGFTEAFDAIVYAGNTDDFGLLATFAAKDKGLGLNMPAFMAIDRMVIDDTTASLQEFLDNSSLMDDRPLTRAGFFARADLSDDEQLKQVSEYVQSLDPSGEEAQYFFSLVPNANFTLTDGILSTRLALPADYVQTRYDAALETVDEWLSDSRYAVFTIQLKLAKTRIEAQLGK